MVYTCELGKPYKVIWKTPYTWGTLLKSGTKIRYEASINLTDDQVKNVCEGFAPLICQPVPSTNGEIGFHVRYVKISNTSLVIEADVIQDGILSQSTEPNIITETVYIITTLPEIPTSTLIMAGVAAAAIVGLALFIRRK